MSKRTSSHRRPRVGLSRGSRAVALASASAMCASLGLTLGATPASAAAVTLYVRVGGSDADANSCNAVGTPCGSVNAAIKRALLRAGDAVTIDIGAGMWTENNGTVATDAMTIAFPTSNAPASVILRGAGAGLTTLRPAADSGKRVLGITGTGGVGIEGLTLTGGGLKSPGTAGAAGRNGGGISAEGTGALVLSNMAVLANVASAGVAGNSGTRVGGAGGNGGGVYFGRAGNLVIDRTTIAGNRSGAGGTSAQGPTGTAGANATSSTDGQDGSVGGTGTTGGIGGRGGGLYVAAGSANVTNSTFTLNSTGVGGAGGKGGTGGTGGAGKAPSLLGLGGAARPGGDGGPGGPGGIGGAGGTGAAIYRAGGTAALTYVTIANNTTGAGGAGGLPGSGGTGGSRGGSTGAAGTVSGATGPAGVVGGLAGAAGTSVTAALFANPVANCDAVVPGAATSAATDASCFAGSGGNVIGSTVGNLGVLANNGGPTPTIATTSGNPAVGLLATCVAQQPTDQRGSARPGSAAPACTAGAYEPQSGQPPVVTPPAGAPPKIVGQIQSATAKTRFNWYRSTVTVNFTCTPGASGAAIVTCPAPVVFSSSGKDQTATVATRDTAGRTASLSMKISVDKTKPTITVRGVKSGKTYNKPRKITCKAVDTFSGPFQCQVGAKAKLVRNGTMVRVNYTAAAVDRAGNVRTKKGKYFIPR